MNLVFISPNFPTYYWNFCKSLRERGVTVLGVGDAPYDDLVNETKESLVEYYRVNNLQNYDEVYRAMGFFIGKYGRIDYIESQNEFWLELEAQLREDFNIHHGLRPKKLEVMKFKSKMKDVYKKANVPTARYKVFKDDQELLDFCKEVGFPIVVKPDNGVGASFTYKLYFCLGTSNNFSIILDFLIFNSLGFVYGTNNSSGNFNSCKSFFINSSIDISLHLLFIILFRFFI